MRQLLREQRPFWFAKYLGKVQIEDGFGRLTGEYTLAYSQPERLLGTVSPRSGNTWGDGFGIGVDCDRTIITSGVNLGIDESCILWVDTEPKVDESGGLILDVNALPETPNDYTITMVAESYRYTSLAIKKVD